MTAYARWVWSFSLSKMAQVKWVIFTALFFTHNITPCKKGDLTWAASKKKFIFFLKQINWLLLGFGKMGPDLTETEVGNQLIPTFFTPSKNVWRLFLHFWIPSKDFCRLFLILWSPSQGLWSPSRTSFTPSTGFWRLFFVLWSPSQRLWAPSKGFWRGWNGRDEWFLGRVGMRIAAWFGGAKRKTPL